MRRVAPLTCTPIPDRAFIRAKMVRPEIVTDGAQYLMCRRWALLPESSFEEETFFWIFRTKLDGSTRVDWLVVLAFRWMRMLGVVLVLVHTFDPCLIVLHDGGDVFNRRARDLLSRLLRRFPK